jgi:hypothetical protein
VGQFRCGYCTHSLVVDFQRDSEAERRWGRRDRDLVRRIKPHSPSHTIEQEEAFVSALTAWLEFIPAKKAPK